MQDYVDYLTHLLIIEKKYGRLFFKNIIEEQQALIKMHMKASDVFISKFGDLEKAIDATNDPEVKKIFEQIKNDKSGRSPIDKLLSIRNSKLSSHFNTAENKVVDDLVYEKKGTYSGLSVREKLKYDLMTVLDSEFDTSLKNIERVINLKKQDKSPKQVNTKTATIAGAAIFTMAPAALSGGLTILQKSHLEKCQNDLNLSKSELDFLTSTPMLSSPKASSSNPVTNFQCSSVQLNNPEETLTQIKLLNDNKIPTGVCQIMQNEMKQVDRLLGDTEMNPKDLSCNGFKDTNVTLSGSDESSTFTYKDGLHTYSAPWNTAQQYPILRSMQITDSDGKRDKNLESTFTSKYNMMHSPSQTEKSPGNLDLASSCLSDKSSVIDCKMVNAIMKARVYSSLKSQFCSNAASGLTPKDAPKINANQ